MDIVHISSDAVGVALVFGALHALEPGHGKTALLAYMADGKKSNWHSVIVGAASLISHTFSILLISLIVHAATHFAGEALSAQTVTWYVGLFSGTLLLGIGCYLIVKSPEPGVHSSHCCHGHQDGKEDENRFTSGKAKFSMSALLGVSVGLYPCPTAIAAYLNAIADGNLKSGYIAIFVYGIGIGLTIMAVGLMSGYMGRSALSVIKGKINPLFLSRIQALVFIVVGASQLFSSGH